jgi:hypothetical protein
MLNTLLLRIACATLLAAGPMSATDAANSTNPFDAAYRTRVQRLCETYDWAKQQRKNILDHSRYWMQQDDAELRRSIPSQMVPRALYLNRPYGCPTCGREIYKHGYYPWIKNPLEHPWKVQCPVCLELFPKNDFYAFYLSGLDENLMFQPDQADQSLLFNTEHPDPNDPLHLYGVDDGTGYDDPEKGSFKFIAHYNHFNNWGANARYPHSTYSFPSGAVALGLAYAATGDESYARKAAVILDRIADVYPDMDFVYWSRQGGFHQYRDVGGKTVDHTWETRVVFDLCRTYALIQDTIDDPALITKIESNIIREAFDKIQTTDILGNVGLTEDTVFMMILASRDPKTKIELTRFVFSEQPDIPDIINGKAHPWRRTVMGMKLGRHIAGLTADGYSWEGGAGYSAILPMALTNNYQTIRRLSTMVDNPYAQTSANLLRQRLAAFYINSYHLMSFGRFTPVWGDGLAFGKIGVTKGAQPELLFPAFAALEDEQVGRIYLSMAPDAEPAGDITNPYIDYEQTVAALEKLKGDSIPVEPASSNMTARGFATLRSGKDQYERAMTAYFGANTGHNHHDTLSLFLFAYEMDLLPGLGYPDISSTQWRKYVWDATIGHNTVAPDWPSRPQDIEIADQKYFVDSPLAMTTQIDATSLYPQLDRYRRTPVVVNVSEEQFYVVDFFEVQGDGDHIYSFHSGVGDVQVEGVELTPQTQGSYAGEDFPFTGKDGDGLQFFTDVRRGDMTGPATMQWNLEDFRDQSKHGDNVRLRMTLLDPLCEIALTKSQPPQNVVGNPEWIDYVLARSTASDDRPFGFTAVLEPFLEGKRAARTVRALDCPAAASAVEVTLADGRRDVIIKSADADSEIKVEGDIHFRGDLLVARFDAAGKLSQMFTVKPSHVRIGHMLTRDYAPSAESTVASFDEGAPDNCTVTAASALTIPANALRPLWLHVEPADAPDRNYEIQSINAGTTVNLGARSLINGLDGETGEYIYDFAPGDHVEIPLSYYWKR